MSTKKVFILNDGGQDFSDAARFGELVYCTEGSLDKGDLHQMFRLLSTYLDQSGPGDYIVLSSLTSLCSVASAIMGALHGEVHFLVYQSSQSKYIPKDLIL